MKKVFLLLVALSAATFTMAQKASPAAEVKGKVGDAEITIRYAQPAVKGRAIWGALVPYDKVWRTGADSATTFEVSKAIKIEGKELAAGKYALFTIPAKNGDFTFIFNKKAEQWGAYNYDEKEDALRVTIKSLQAPFPTENLTFLVSNVSVILAWEERAAAFGIAAID
jgi:uncharacterized protein (DUF2141 family)